MKIRYTLLILLVVFLKLGSAQPNLENICRVEENKLIFKFFTNWSGEEQYKIARMFSIDTLFIQTALQSDSFFIFENEKWMVEHEGGKIVYVSKLLLNKPDVLIEKYDNIWNLPNENILPPQYQFLNRFGVNDFKYKNSFMYSDSVATFYIPGFKSAKKVYIAGNFNGWSTFETPLQKNDSGWVVKIHIHPGKIIYKYIIDGNWTLDPGNNQTENDANGIVNSVAFAPNYVFKLNGFLNEKKVSVSGNFMLWKKKGIPMQKKANGWEVPVYFQEGTYTYKFIVGKKWIEDPDNHNKTFDTDGNVNSVLEFGQKYIFYLPAHLHANRVILTGTFNAWIENELQMQKTDSGWVLPYVLGAGNHEYKYIVDGKWTIDSLNPYKIGLYEMTNSVLAVEPNFEFVLKNFQDVKEVIVTGTFNGWNPEGYTMQKKDGVWIFPIHLQPGKHLYKFIVDGEWIHDPYNPLYESNEHLTYNSILWMR